MSNRLSRDITNRRIESPSKTVAMAISATPLLVVAIMFLLVGAKDRINAESVYVPSLPVISQKAPDLTTFGKPDVIDTWAGLPVTMSTLSMFRRPQPDLSKIGTPNNP